MVQQLLLSACVVILLASSGVVRCDFSPGCSFVGGQCQYSVTLGHAGQCDSATAAAGTGSGTTSGNSLCCETVKADLTSVRSDIDLLQSQVKGLMNDLNRARSDLTQAQMTVNQTEAERDALLETLRQKETELNTTQAELANLIHRTGNEITALRSELANMTSQANTCRAALGLPTVDPKLSTSVGGPVSQHYCNFNSISEHPCKWTVSSQSEFHLVTRSSSTNAGPAADRSQGSVTGKYLALDGRKVAQLHSSSTAVIRSYTAVSGEFQPADDYCFIFYYSMVGKDVQSLEVTIKIGSGVGYPVWSTNGRRMSEWTVGQFELDSEYTANPFS
ncbi:aggrecan core protein, partial [Elysia marginata]